MILGGKLFVDLSDDEHFDRNLKELEKQIGQVIKPLRVQAEYKLVHVLVGEGEQNAALPQLAATAVLPPSQFSFSRHSSARADNSSSSSASKLPTTACRGEDRR